MALEFQNGSARVALDDTGAAAGDIASVANPEGVTCIIERAYLLIETPSSGASTIDVGVGASATTSYDNLIDGVSGAAAGVFSNLKNAGSNGKADQLWTASQYITASEASGDTTGLAGWLIVDYRRADFE